MNRVGALLRAPVDVLTSLEAAAVDVRLGGDSVLVHLVDLLERKALGLGERDEIRNADGEFRCRGLTSGTQKYVKIMQHAQVEPQMKNTFTSRPAEPGAVLTR